MSKTRSNRRRRVASNHGLRARQRKDVRSEPTDTIGIGTDSATGSEAGAEATKAKDLGGYALVKNAVAEKLAQFAAEKVEVKE